MQFHYLPKLSIFFSFGLLIPSPQSISVELYYSHEKQLQGRLDHSLISLYIDSTCSNIQLMRIKEALSPRMRSLDF